MSKTKIHLIYERNYNDMYAWTLDKNLAEMFMATRNPKMFKHVINKIDTSTAIGDWEFRVFMNDYSGSQLMNNILGTGKDNCFYFPTTYYENMRVEEACDKVFNAIGELSSSLFELPLSDTLRKSIETLTTYAMKDGGSNIQFDSFLIFAKIFRETLPI